MEGLFKIEGRIYVLVLEQRFLTSSILSNLFPFTLDPPYAALTAGDLSVIDIQSKVHSLGMLDTGVRSTTIHWQRNAPLFPTPQSTTFSEMITNDKMCPITHGQPLGEASTAISFPNLPCYGSIPPTRAICSRSAIINTCLKGFLVRTCCAPVSVQRLLAKTT